VSAGSGLDRVSDSFDIDDYTRWRLLEGLDDIAVTLGHEADIVAYERSRPSWKPRPCALTAPSCSRLVEWSRTWAHEPLAFVRRRGFPYGAKGVRYGLGIAIKENT
jgi:hypothetical protein